ncbi:hypothetical protein [Dyadobacter sp. CY351]|uniref:hypothetical protein n=1 Tax=Dyadobacter sp. CY351 TaxID=2909337 RepID=UPI001F1F4278|nr:hypothetical protein [Dyadobacter sp. CY351]MCF2521062.1 hypothetical protein [Dyadobacter sp. CY351]
MKTFYSSIVTYGREFWEAILPAKPDEAPSTLPPTYILDVAIEMHRKFDFDNLPHSGEDEFTDKNKPYIGRENLHKKFKKMLTSKKGVYLITGYRGMGKTSFVNRTLQDFNKKRSPAEKLTEIKITIAQRQPKETDILIHMVSGVREVYCKKYFVDELSMIKRIITSLVKYLGITFLATLFLFLYKRADVQAIFTSDEYGSTVWAQIIIYSKILMISSLLAFCLAVICLLAYDWLGTPSAWTKIDDLFKKCYAATSTESADSQEINLESLSTKIGYAGGKRTEVYQIASSKEIENELRSIINDYPENHLVFVFDELDKVDIFAGLQGFDSDLTNSLNAQNYEKAYFDELRARKRAIQQIIAGLKSFLTTTKAVFIFIAGREMYEASLADIADRQSSLGSIFSYVFYIESLLKEPIDGTASLSAGIEEYLYMLIEKGSKTGSRSLYTPNFESYTGPLSETNSALKVNMLLQNFVVYLTYRSNGSPKKLIKLIHEFITVDKLDPRSGERIVRRQIRKKTFRYLIKSAFVYLEILETIDPALDWIFSTKLYKLYRQKWVGEKCYLFFDYRQQQRIGYISYLYRPFLVKYGNSFKQYSDNLVVSTSFLFDHIFKFHPFAFSRSHLELMPEVLSTNRTPALRDHIKKIIEYLTLNHIKETEIGLFEYKFYSKTVNEIVYLSKTFEEESAAFNFTLDESYVIKHQVISKLRDLKEANRSDITLTNGSAQISSIAYLNGMLGDLHFFDQEYDDAIIAYSEAITAIGAINAAASDMQTFLLLQKYRLKLGLTYEKINCFEESLALYSGAASSAKHYILSILDTSNEKKLNRSKIHSLIDEEGFLTPTSLNASLSDVLQVVNQAFLAEMLVQEKMGVEGITALKNGITMGGFLQLTESVAIFTGTNNTIIANFYLHVANILYFKNSVKAFEWPKSQDFKFIPQKHYDELNWRLSDRNLANYGPSESRPYRSPIIAVEIYFIGLKHVLEGRVFDDKFRTSLSNLNPITIFDILRPDAIRPYMNSLSKIHFKYIATHLSHIGDCLLSMLQLPLEDSSFDGCKIVSVLNTRALARLAKGLRLAEIEKTFPGGLKIDSDNGQWIMQTFNELSLDIQIKCPTPQIIANILPFLITIYNTKDSDNFEKLWSLRKGGHKYVSFHNIICLYYLSSYYFDLASRPRSESFQLRKILYVVRLVIAENRDHRSVISNLIDAIEKSIVKRVLHISSQTAEFSDIHDFNKFREKLQVLNKKSRTKQEIKSADIKDNLSNSADTREALILLEHIKLRLPPNEISDFKSPLVFSSTSMSTQYLRLLELTYSAKLHEIKIKYDIKSVVYLRSSDKFAPFGNKTKDILLHCISYLHSMISIVQIMEIYDNDYLVGNSFLAYHHYRLGNFFSFDSFGNNRLNVPKTLVEEAKEIVLKKYSIDKSSYTLFDRDYNFESAALHYDKAIKLHTAGDDYKKAMYDIVYLEDDLNDSAYHFGAAMDRFLLTNRKLHHYRDLSDSERNLQGYRHSEKKFPQP